MGLVLVLMFLFGIPQCDPEHENKYKSQTKYKALNSECSVSENIHTPITVSQWNSRRGGGGRDLKSQNF